ncbi:hypothetical protein BGW38_004798 [Lunasporangiospora selenospora]|uniref:Bromo domain-containing protein n=1 Tax=Lunasporangiospora selenospora TaxID=979761 RepID=A0A9P6FQU9_9FUNG|nr:hypothetical protein BGW38_004798 [Lunasporangiospora selenospora]
MEESTIVNGSHPVADTSKKRPSLPSPLTDSPTSPSHSGEPKRPKTAEFGEGRAAQKNTEVTQAEFNEVLTAILDVIQGLDKHKTLATIAKSTTDGETVECSLKTIREKLQESDYSSVYSFRDDLSTIFNHVIVSSGSGQEMQEHAQRLSQLASDLISDKAHYSIRSHGKKVRPREETQVSLPTRDYEKVALFQRGSEGFVFTSKVIVGANDDVTEPGLSQTVVVPVISTTTPPLLKDVNPRPRPLPPTPDYIKRKAIGVEYCPYDAFASFAPYADSTNAALNAEDTSIAYDALVSRHAKKSKHIVEVSEEEKAAKAQLESILDVAKQYQSQENGVKIVEDDLKFLIEEGIDVQELLLSSNSLINGKEQTPTEAIQKNAMLLLEIYRLQEERFSSKDHTITPKEHELASILQKSLAELANQLTPSQLVSLKAIEDAMRRIPYKDSAFVGSLPPSKPFAYPTNTSRNGVPATATGLPLHVPVAHKRASPPMPVIPQVALSPQVNMTGGYPFIPQTASHAYSSPQQPPTHQKTYSRPRAENTPVLEVVALPQPLQVEPNGQFTFRKNFHLVTTTGGTPSHWRRNDSQTPCANCGTLVSHKDSHLKSVFFKDWLKRHSDLIGVRFSPRQKPYEYSVHVRENSTQAKRDRAGQVKTRYSCHRKSQKYEDKNRIKGGKTGNPRLRSPSIKSQCKSTINSLFRPKPTSDGRPGESYRIEYNFQHNHSLGRMENLGTLRLSQSVNQKIATMLSTGLPIDVVLDQLTMDHAKIARILESCLGMTLSHMTMFS